VFVKYNSDGAKEWFKCRQSAWSDTAYTFMFQTLDEKFVLGGMANNGSKWVVRKEDGAGNGIWTKAYGGSGSQMLYSMIQTDDGGFIMFGSAYGGDGDIGFHYGSAGTRDFWVLKVDTNGDKVWSRVYGGTGEDLGGAVAMASDGGCYIVGSTNSTDNECTGNHGATDAFVARLNDSGILVWSKMLGGSGFDGGVENEGCNAVADGKGGLLIASASGSSDGDVSHQINDPGSNIWVIQLDSTGGIMWDNCYGGGGTEYPNAVCYATDRSIWIMGCSQVAGGQVNVAYGSRDAYVVHMDSVGNFLNAKVIGSTAQDVGYIIHPLRNGLVFGGGYYMNGNGTFPNIHNGFSDAFVAKFTNWTNEIQVFSTEVQFSVWPNPSRDAVIIEKYNDIPSTIVVSNTLGRTIYNSTINSKIWIPVHEWAAGMYYVHLINDRGYREVQKLIVK
jgi:hypothetical protein